MSLADAGIVQAEGGIEGATDLVAGQQGDLGAVGQLESGGGVHAAIYPARQAVWEVCEVRATGALATVVHRPNPFSGGSVRPSTSISTLALAAMALSVTGCEALLGGADTDTDDVDDPGDCAPSQEFTACDPDNPQDIYYVDTCGNLGERKTTCSPTTRCEIHSEDGQAHCACPLTGQNTCGYDTRATLYEDSWIERERSCASARPDPADRVADCGFGEVCFQEEGIRGGEAHCRRSVTEENADKPYYDHSCGTFDEWLRHPTRLEIDCRCRRLGDGSGGKGGTLGETTGNGYVDPNNPHVEDGGFPGGPIINCAKPREVASKTWPVPYGQGPSFGAWLEQNESGSSWFSGDVDPERREMYGLIRWTNPTYSRSATLVAWDLDTGDRRVISGLYPDPRAGQVEYGSGYLSPPPASGTGARIDQPLTGGNRLRLADDGYIYVAGGGTGEGSSEQREIVRVDRDTGERTLVWLAQSEYTGDISDRYGQCFRPNALDGLDQTLNLNAQSFEVGPDGTFYMGFRDVRGGDGLVAISADGRRCDVIARWGGRGHNPGGVDPVPPPEPIGSGYDLQFPVNGLLWHEDRIYGVSNDQLIAFDPRDGRRLLVSYSPGSYSGMGYANLFWDDGRKVFWAVGTVSRYVGSVVDPATGHVESVYGDSGRRDYGEGEAILKSVYQGERSVDGTMLSEGHGVFYGAFVLDPDDPDIVYGVLKAGGLMKLELSTFNNYIFSY